MNILTMIGKAIWDLLRAIFGSLGVLLNSLFGGIFKPLWENFRRMFRFNSEEIKRPLLVLVSALVIIISLVSIFLTLRTPSDEINLKPLEGLGTVLAEETVKLLEGRGDVVVLALKVENAAMPTIGVPVEFFRKTLRTHPQLTIRETETISPSLEAMYGPVSPLTIDQLVQLMTKHQFVDAIVTFVDLPALSDEDWDKLPKRRPKLICAGSYSSQLRQLFEKNIVQLAVSPRFQTTNETREPVTSREWFDRYYVIVTPDNLSVLPEFRTTPPK